MVLILLIFLKNLFTEINMCRHPIKIKNPYYGLGSKGINKLHDTVHTYIEVPCGHCDQCFTFRQTSYLQRVQMESLNNDLFFFTLTYNDQHLPTINHPRYGLIKYPNFKDVQSLFRRLQTYYKRRFSVDIRYFVVSEYGKKSLRPHFHGIISLPKTFSRSNQGFKSNLSSAPDNQVSSMLYNLVKKFWSVNKGTRKNPIYEPLFTDVNSYRGRTFDLHYIQPSFNHENDVSFYVSKYIFKYDKRINKFIGLIASSEYPEDYDLIKLIKPRCIMSKKFGLWTSPDVQKHIKYSISTDSQNPTFIDIYTGKHMPLNRYYKRHLLPMSYVWDKFYNSSSDCLTSSHKDKEDIDLFHSSHSYKDRTNYLQDLLFKKY